MANMAIMVNMVNRVNIVIVGENIKIKIMWNYDLFNLLSYNVTFIVKWNESLVIICF